MDQPECDWLYIDASGNQKGPISTSLLLKLTEKNVSVTANTMVWTQNMENWHLISQVPQFSRTVDFNMAFWHFVDDEGATKGPVATRMIIHKLDDGSLNGMSLVYSSFCDNAWKRVSDIPSLKDAYATKQAEAEAASQATAVMAAMQQEQQVFIDSDDEVDRTRIQENQKRLAMLAEDAAKAAENEADEETKGNGIGGENKAFMADNGTWYKWDPEEEDWVEDEGNDGKTNHMPMDDSESNSDVDFNVGKKKRQTPTVPTAGVSTVSTGEGAPVEEAAVKKAPKTAEELAEIRENKKRKRKNKARAAALSHWVYIVGLPSDVTADEIKAHFSKVGLIAINPLDQCPKIKIYREEHVLEGDSLTGGLAPCKGDASLCYHAIESVSLAVDILNGGYIRQNFQITVAPAEFASKNETSGGAASSSSAARPQGSGTKHPRITQAQLKVAKTATKQALAWNEADDEGINKHKALKIVVLENLFSLQDFDDDNFLQELENDLASECGKCGEIDKITVFSEHPNGVVIIKFGTSFAAQDCISKMEGRYFGGSKIKAMFWDGITNYAAVKGSRKTNAPVDGNVDSTTQARHESEDDNDTNKLEAFGDWLDEQQDELPEEFQLRVES